MSCDYCAYCMEPAPQNAKCPHCGQMPAYEAPIHHLKPGTVLREKYMIGRALGEGGFGITYIGRDLTLDMRIAVKEYYPNGFSNRNSDYSNVVTMSKGNQGHNFEKEMQRFLSEARVLARFCNDPGVVGVRDFFQENGTAYIVMEYLDGITLKNYLKKYGPVPVDTFIEMIDPILQALNEIHNQGLIHRDISPDNVMVLKNGRLKLLDFGAAREVAGDKSLSVMLKPGYAPEEQYRSKGQQGSWTDVYAMCATIYKCITGVTPDESIQRVFEDELKKPSQMGVRISPQVENALMQGLSVKSTDRIQTMDQLRKAFRDEGKEMRNVQIHRTEDNRTITCAGDEVVPPAQKKPDITAKQVVSGNQKPVQSQSPVKKNPQSSVVNKPQTANPVAKMTPENKPINPQSAKPAVQKAPASSASQAANKDKPSTRKKKGGKGKVVVVILVVAILMGIVTLAAGGGVLALVLGGRDDSWKETKPTERIMANDCSQVLETDGISGAVLFLEVQHDELNEKYKTYSATCEVTVLERYAENTYTVELYYEYEDGAWVLGDLSAVSS